MRESCFELINEYLGKILPLPLLSHGIIQRSIMVAMVSGTFFGWKSLRKKAFPVLNLSNCHRGNWLGRWRMGLWQRRLHDWRSSRKIPFKFMTFCARSDHDWRRKKLTTLNYNFGIGKAWVNLCVKMYINSIIYASPIFTFHRRILSKLIMLVLPPLPLESGLGERREKRPEKKSGSMKLWLARKH